MDIPNLPTHPQGEEKLLSTSNELTPLDVDTFGGKITVEWDSDAAVTPLGQLPFFIQFLKVGDRFDPYVNECPLRYASNNAPKKVDVLGSLLLSILSGHNRYAHLATLANDRVNPRLLGMNKVVSDDSACRALKRMDEEEGTRWLQKHLFESYEPLLQTAWILDVDNTVKPLYGQQEGAKKGYNPQKPGRPSHNLHTYMIANLRLILDVDVHPGDESQSKYVLPGLLELLERLPAKCQPRFIRGDIDWGNDPIMSQLERLNYQYLFKLKKSANVKKLIAQHHGLGEWTRFNSQFEAKEATVKLQGWNADRRVVLVRRRISNEGMVGLEHETNQQLELAFIDGPEEMKMFEYSVLVTNLDEEVISLVQHYRDRADCENNFDEIKNQWGWGGFTSQVMKSTRLMARMIALIYNWWTLFVRLANPENHLEALTSRPLLLSSVGRLTQSGRQKKMFITSCHGKIKVVQKAYQQLDIFFKKLKLNAPQLTSKERWRAILIRVMKIFKVVVGADPPQLAQEAG